MLPNLQQVRFVRPMISRTAFHQERLDFWWDHGLEDWAEQPCEIREQGNPSKSRFPWHPHVLLAGLQLLPSTCKSLELDIPLFYWPFGNDSQPKQFTKQHSRVFSRLDLLKLTVDPYVEVPYVNPGLGSGEVVSRRARFTGKFSNITSLEIDCSCGQLTYKYARYSHTAALISKLYSRFCLSKLQILSLARWKLDSCDIQPIYASFPALQEMHVENMVFEVGHSKNPSETVDEDAWFSLANLLSKKYEGRCKLEFGDGPFFQVEGSFNGDHPNFSPDYDPTITIILKEPAWRLLPSISCSPSTECISRDQYKAIAEHAPPKVLITNWELEEREMKYDYEPRFTNVETPGMTFMYYDVLDFGTVQF